jgi:hypothetical protein
LGIGSVFSNQRILQVFLTISVVLLAIGINQPISAERSFYFEKVLDINKKSFQDSLTNLNNLPKIFPENIKSVKPSSDENENKAKMTLGVGGFSINSEVELAKETNSVHTMKIISGDLEGTKITTSLKETWSYDGIPNEGTIIEIDMILQTSGFLSLIGLASDETILYSLDKSLLDVVSYVKSKNDVLIKEKQFESKNEPSEIKSDQKINKRPHRR